MPIQAQFYQTFKGLAIAPEDVTIGDGDSQEISIFRGGKSVGVSYSRRTVTVTARGVNPAQAQPFISEARNNRRNLVLGTYIGEDLNFGGDVVKNCVLVRAIPSPVTITVAGIPLLESLQLEYQSLIYD